jgi:hypothetical protein
MTRVSAIASISIQGVTHLRRIESPVACQAGAQFGSNDFDLGKGFMYNLGFS